MNDAKLTEEIQRALSLRADTVLSGRLAAGARSRFQRNRRRHIYSTAGLAVATAAAATLVLVMMTRRGETSEVRQRPPAAAATNADKDRQPLPAGHRRTTIPSHRARANTPARRKREHTTHAAVARDLAEAKRALATAKKYQAEIEELLKSIALRAKHPRKAKAVPAGVPITSQPHNGEFAAHQCVACHGSKVRKSPAAP